MQTLAPYQTPELFRAVAISIFVLLGAAAFFLLWTIFKRLKKMNEARMREQFQATIDQVLFELLFNQVAVADVLSAWTIYQQSILFKKVAIKSIIGLHHNYAGAQKLKLREIFVTSGLVHYSLQKMAESNPVSIVEGIRDVSELHYEPAIPAVRNFLNHKNPFVQKEACIGLVKLRGPHALLELMNWPVYIDDWTQSNILFTVKANAVNPPENLPMLLHSSNFSLALLGARLIDYYQQPQHLEVIQQFMQIPMAPHYQAELRAIESRLIQFLKSAL